MKAVLARHKSIAAVVGLIVVLGVTGQIVSSGFLGPGNIAQLIIQASFIALVALGQTFVLLTAGVDLSIPWVLNAAAILLTLNAGSGGVQLLWVIPALVVLGALVGLVNGLGVTKLRVPPIIMTLGMASIVQGGILLYTNGGSGGNTPNEVKDLSTQSWGPLPALGIVWLVVLIGATVVLTMTSFGRRIYATGLNERVSRFSGINTAGVTVTAYILSGAGAALTGILLSGYVGQSYLGMGNTYLFASVAAAAIGGVSILGGVGTYIGASLGALALIFLASILPILGLPPAALRIVYGSIILIAVAASSGRLASRRRARTTIRADALVRPDPSERPIDLTKETQQ